MEVYKKIQNNLNVLSKISLNDVFPNSIYYPNQKTIEDKETSDADSEIININSSNVIILDKNLEKEKIQIDNSKNSNDSVFQNDLDSENISPINLKTNKNQKKLKKGKTEKIIKNFKKINFPNLFDIWDIVLDNDILACCGKNHIKVFFLKNPENNSHSIPLENINEISYNANSKNISFTDLYHEEITFSDKNEEFYCLSLSEIKINNEVCKVLAVGGTKAIIKILDLTNRKEYKSLIGHRNEIYDLKSHPFLKNILLSASKDYSIRLWNITSGSQLCIFGGPKGHSAEVLAIDWHLSGDYFVSSGIDNTVKIWEITDKIKTVISTSNQETEDFRSENSEKIFKKKKFKTIVTTKIMFSSKTIHENYVDSVKFNGNFIISKSMDGVVKEWLPVFNNEADYYMIINCYTYEVNELVWYMKLGIDLDSKYFATGNTQGKLFIFKLNEDIEDEIVEEEFDYFYQNSFNYVIETGVNKLIRSVAVFQDKIAFGNSDGSIYYTQVGLDC